MLKLSRANWLTAALVLVVLSFSVEAHAQANSAGIFDEVLRRYSSAASSWGSVIIGAASRLFWTLVLISMVWTFGMMALRNADIGEFFAEFIRFTIFTGFFWWLLVNGPSFASSIYASLRQVASEATGLNGSLTPSGIVDIGFEIFFRTTDRLSLLTPIDSATAILMSLGILVLLALVGVNMLLLLASGWILAYAGAFFLGFGGSRWTSDMAINYFKTVLGIAAQLMAMVLLVGIGKTFLEDYYLAMSQGVNVQDLAVLLIVCIILLALVNKIPSLIAGVITGSSIGGSGIGQFGAGAAFGAAVGAAGMASAAASMGGSMIAAGAANAAGGAQALMAACSQAGDNVADGSDIISEVFGDKSAAYRGGYSNPQSGSSGSSDGGSSSQSSSADSSTGNSADESGGTEESGGDDKEASSSSSDDDSNQSQGGPEKSSGSISSSTSGSTANSGPTSGSGATSASGTASSSSSNESNNSTSNSSAKASSNSNSSSAFSSEPTDFSNDSFDSPSSRKGESGNAGKNAQPSAGSTGPNALISGMKSTAAAAGKMAATAGKLTADAGANLVKGTATVAKTKVSGMKEAASQRISETVGGKIAAAIKDLNNGSHATTAGNSKPGSSPATFTGNSIGGAARTSQDSTKSHFPHPSEYKNRSNEKDFDPAAEIAAFVNRKNPDTI